MRDVEVFGLAAPEGIGMNDLPNPQFAWEFITSKPMTEHKARLIPHFWDEFSDHQQKKCLKLVRKKLKGLKRAHKGENDRLWYAEKEIAERDAVTLRGLQRDIDELRRKYTGVNFYAMNWVQNRFCLLWQKKFGVHPYYEEV